MKPEEHIGQGVSRSHGVAEVTRQSGEKGLSGREFQILTGPVLKQGAMMPTPGGRK